MITVYYFVTQSGIKLLAISLNKKYKQLYSITITTLLPITYKL